jgi:hypothetical protein
MKGNSACDEFAAATRAASTSKQVGALPLMGSKAKSANAIAVPAPCRRHGMDSKRDLSLSGCKVNCKVVKLHAVTACRRRSTRCHSVHADSVLSARDSVVDPMHACISLHIHGEGHLNLHRPCVARGNQGSVPCREEVVAVMPRPRPRGRASGHLYRPMARTPQRPKREAPRGLARTAARARHPRARL